MVEPIIFFIEKIALSLKLFSGHFYGQIFIKTVRGPYHRRAYKAVVFCVLFFVVVFFFYFHYKNVNVQMNGQTAENYSFMKITMSNARF